MGTNSSVLIGAREKSQIYLRRAPELLLHEYASDLWLLSFSESEVDSCTCPSFANKRITCDIQMQKLGCISMLQFVSTQAPKRLGETLLARVPYNSARCLWESRDFSPLAPFVPGSDSTPLCDKLYVNSVVQHIYRLWHWGHGCVGQEGSATEVPKTMLKNLALPPEVARPELYQG